MENINEDYPVLFHRLWSLEYTSRNQNFINSRNKILDIEDLLKRDIEIIDSEIEKLPNCPRIASPETDPELCRQFEIEVEKYPWMNEESSYFEDRFYDGRKTEHYKNLSDRKKKLINDAVKIDNHIKVIFGFDFYEKPARDSLFLLEHINDPGSIIFPKSARGAQAGYWLRGKPMLNIKNPTILASYLGGTPEEVEERPGDVFLCFNFYQPLPVLINLLESMYHEWRGDREKLVIENINGRDTSSYYEKLLYTNTPGAVIPESQSPRAVGLWLWDSLEKNGGKHKTIIKAIDELEGLDCFPCVQLGENPDYYHFLRRTNACIEAAEVLSFEKKKTKDKSKKGSGTKNAK
jgi:hypothetical protein